MNTQTLRFIRRGEIVSLDNVPPDRTLLQVLREDLRCIAVKEGCGEGDCGACTVVIAEDHGDGLHYQAINSCIRLAHSVDGLAVWTADDLPPPGGAAAAALHPVQQALVDHHASQCGFCTPGFAMSLFGLYQGCGGQAVDEAQARTALSGNLCRCTGYRPILDAAQAMHRYPAAHVDEAALREGLQRLANDRRPAQAGPAAAGRNRYDLPRRLSELLSLRAAHPQARLVAGCTDVGLWVTKQHQSFDHVIDLTRVAELRRVETYPHHIAIGAAVTLEAAFEALVAERPALRRFTERFAGRPVRQSGTLGGNVANGSPIGDSMPLLIALGASVVLMSGRGHREWALEDFYTGYRQNRLAPDEVLAWIKVPRPVPSERLGVWKVSKRADDDISAVCLAVRLELEGGQIRSARVGAGGVAATPARARATEAALAGQPWNADTAATAAAALGSEFAPISDMRASAGYRRTVLGNLMRRFWLESPEAGTGGPVTLEALA